MLTVLQKLYYHETSRAHLDFGRDMEYQSSLAQAETLWPDGEMPEPVFLLLERSNFLSFAHGFRLGLRLARWADRDGRGSAAPAAGSFANSGKGTKAPFKNQGS